MSFHVKILTASLLLGLIGLACAPGLLTRSQPTATPTKTSTLPAITPPTPTPLPPTPTSTITPLPMPPTPTTPPTPEPTATPLPPTETPVPEPTATPVPAEPTSPPPEPAEEQPAAPATAEPAAAATEEPTYKIVHYKVLGEGENNGGIFNAGGQHLIFLTVLDENGNGLDGAVVKDANGSDLEVVTGSKGPGKAEISMEWDPYKLYVAADPAGPTTSEVSNQMNTAFPHIPDVVGKLGDINNEYSVCPTVDVRCEPPFYNVHFSYEITFQRQP